jgi:hypothetical protein
LKSGAFELWVMTGFDLCTAPPRLLDDALGQRGLADGSEGVDQRLVVAVQVENLKAKIERK